MRKRQGPTPQSVVKGLNAFASLQLQQPPLPQQPHPQLQVSKNAYNIQIILQQIGESFSADGANWEVHPETGCVQFKYCPPTPSCAVTTTTTTTTTPAPFMTRNTGFMVGVRGGSADFASLNPDTQPLPACFKGGESRKQGAGCYPFVFVNQGICLHCMCPRHPNYNYSYFQMMDCPLRAAMLVSIAVVLIAKNSTQLPRNGKNLGIGM